MWHHSRRRGWVELDGGGKKFVKDCEHDMVCATNLDCHFHMLARKRVPDRFVGRTWHQVHKGLKFASQGLKFGLS